MGNQNLLESAKISIKRDIEKVNALRNLSSKENASSATNKVINPQNVELRNGTLLNS